MILTFKYPIVFVAYWIINTNRTMVAAPGSFYFSTENTKGDYDLYYIDDAVWFDEDEQPENASWDSDAVHLFVDAKYLEDEWNYVYVSGNYWYSPVTPTITVNNQEITSVKTDTHSGSMKNYYFYLYEIEEDMQYTITVRCGEDRERIKVVFHAE